MKAEDKTKEKLIRELRQRIAELEKSQIKRKWSEEEYKTILSTAMDGFWLVDKEGRFLDMNDAYCHLIGYSRDELLKMRVQDVEASEKPEETASHIQRVMDIGSDRFETRHKCKDGKTVDIEVSVNYMDVEGGRLFVFLRDITERKWADETMRKKTKELSALYTIAKTVSQSHDMDEMLNGTLETVLQIMGADGGGIYLLEEDGINLHLKVHKGFSQKSIEAVKTIKVGTGVSGRALELKKVIAIDVSHYPTRSLIPILKENGIKFLASTPIAYKNKILGTISIHYRRPCTFLQEERDIFTSIGNELGVAIENARLFNELEKHHKMLGTLYSIESVVSGSLNLEEIYKLALSKALEVTDTDAGTLYSFDGEVLRLEACEGLCPEFKKKAVIRKVGDGIPGMAVESKKPISLDITEFPSPPLLPYMTREGLVSFIGTPLLSKEKVVGALALGTKKKQKFTQDDLDILLSIGNTIGIATENARLYKESKDNLEKLQKAYEELQSLDKMKDEFISNISHELKTPLISIKGYGELLYDEKLKGRINEQKKSLEAIIRNADRLTRLIDSILFISKLQTGNIEFHFEALDMDEIVQLCLSDFRRMLDKKHIEFEKDIPLISKVKGDKDKFMEAITNLLDNAIKFTSEGGKISIKAWDEAENVHFTVSDNGIGIPAEIETFYYFLAGSNIIYS